MQKGYLMTSKILEVNFEDPIVSLATIANTCYSTLSLDDNKEKFTHNREKAKKLVKNLIKSGHHSVLEHVTLTIEFTGSRAFTHQLVRHRLASYTQRSQRYCDEKNFNNYIPQSILKNEKALEIFNSLLSNIESVYTDLQKLGISNEDARYILPNSCMSTIICTVNLRELLHMFQERLCYRAQDEIRDAFEEVLKELKLKQVELYEILLPYIGPSCIKGPCREEKPCGKGPRVFE